MKYSQDYHRTVLNIQNIHIFVMGLIDQVAPRHTSLDWNLFTFANPRNTISPHRYLLSAIANEHECVLATNILKVVLSVRLT